MQRYQMTRVWNMRGKIDRTCTKLHTSAAVFERKLCKMQCGAGADM